MSVVGKLSVALTVTPNKGENVRHLSLVLFSPAKHGCHCRKVFNADPLNLSTFKPSIHSSDDKSGKGRKGTIWDRDTSFMSAACFAQSRIVDRQSYFRNSMDERDRAMGSTVQRQSYDARDPSELRSLTVILRFVQGAILASCFNPARSIQKRKLAHLFIILPL